MWGRIRNIRFLSSLPGALLALFATGLLSAETATLAGKTRLPQLPNARVTVLIGETSTMHTADQLGAFSAEVTFTPGAELVRIEACGIADQSEICHVRLVHTSAEIEARAGADRIFWTGNLSPISTAAWAALVEAVPGAAPPTEFAEVEEFRRAFDSSPVLYDAAILSLLAGGAAPLPAGAEDLIDVVLDPTLLAEARNSLDPEALEQEREALTQNDNFMHIPDVDFSIPGTSYFARVRSNVSGDVAFRLALVPGGSGEYAQLRASGSVEWTNAHAGEVIFADDMEAVGTGTRFVAMIPLDGDSIIPPRSFFFFPPGESETVEGQVRLEEVQWRELDASELMRPTLLREVRNSVAPDRPDLDPEKIEQLGPTLIDWRTITRGEGEAVPPSPVPVASSLWAFPRCDTDCTSDAGIVSGANVDLIDFNVDGTASSEIVDPGLTWTQAGQRTLIEQSDGIQVEIVPFGSTARHIGDLETTLVIAAATLPDGQVLTTSQLAIEADPGFQFSAETIPGRYESMPPIDAVFVLDPDGTGWLAFLDEPIAPRPDTGGFDVEWLIEPTGDLLLVIKERDQDSVVGWWALRPVRKSAAGFYAIERLSFSGPATESAGTLLFWREVQ